jgi:hypothetical protein
MQEVKNPIQPRGITLVRQKLTWRSTPIKRIDRLEVGKTAHLHSDRLKTLPLIPYDFKVKDPLGLNTAALSAVATDAASNSASGSTGLGMMGDRASGGSSQTTSMKSANHEVPLERYIEVTSQLRRMPVALVMVVDATAITDIIAAMSNSKLRFQVTMAPWVKVPNLGRPGGAIETAGGGAPSNQSGSGGAGKVKSGGGGGAATIGGSGGSRPAGDSGSVGSIGGPGNTSGGVTGGPGTGTNPPAASNLGLEDDSSVVELQIYGVITIYESPDQFKRIQQQKANAPAQATGATTPK